MGAGIGLPGVCFALLLLGLLVEAGCIISSMRGNKGGTGKEGKGQGAGKASAGRGVGLLASCILGLVWPGPVGDHHIITYSFCLLQWFICCFSLFLSTRIGAAGYLHWRDRDTSHRLSVPAGREEGLGDLGEWARKQQWLCRRGFRGGT
jgi:hypothetical protein